MILINEEFKENSQIQESIKKENYKLIKLEIENNKESFLQQTSLLQINQIIFEQEKLLIEIKKPSTFIYDLDLMKTISDLVIQQGNDINFSSKYYNLYNFSYSIFNKFNLNSKFINFLELGNYFLSNSKTLPNFNLINFYGLTINLKPKIIKKTQNQTQNNIILPQIDLKYLTKKNSRTQNLTSKSLKIFQKIKEKKSIPLILALNSPKNYNKLIHKAFHFAHLIREGKVGLNYEEEEIITKIIENKEEEIKPKRKNCILHFSFNDYLKLTNEN